MPYDPPGKDPTGNPHPPTNPPPVPAAAVEPKGDDGPRHEKKDEPLEELP